MKTTITYEDIMSFRPCYDPKEIGMPEDYGARILEFIDEYRDKVKDKSDIIWLICRDEYMTDKDLRLFAVWCAREALKLVSNPDHRSVEACNVAERYANGLATDNELYAASDAAWGAASAAASASAKVAASVAASDAAWAAARVAARAAARVAQINKLKTYFK